MKTEVKQIVPAINENKLNIDKKQNKLTAGTNITIDENNKISATGGSTDLSDYYTKKEIDKLKNEFYTVISFKQEKNDNHLETIEKEIVPAINEINKKQPGGSNWKEVGTIASNYSTVNYNFKVNKLYRLSFTWKAINIKKTVIQYLNFYVETENVEFTILATMYQENNQDWRLCMSKDLIAVINRNSERLENCIFKLEELQE